MMSMSAAKQRADRLEKMARAAITQYNKDTAAGGEPLFPDWALDLIGLISDFDKIIWTLEKQEFGIFDTVDFETNAKNSTVVQIHRAAL